MTSLTACTAVTAPVPTAESGRSIPTPGHYGWRVAEVPGAVCTYIACDCVVLRPLCSISRASMPSIARCVCGKLRTMVAHGLKGAGRRWQWDAGGRGNRRDTAGERNDAPRPVRPSARAIVTLYVVYDIVYYVRCAHHVLTDNISNTVHSNWDGESMESTMMMHF